MKEICIECAGAGKTYGIAQNIAKLLEHCPNEKIIYAITYTNYAVRQIEEELIKKLREIPMNVSIKTIHSFLLENIIYPFSGFVKGIPINSCSIVNLHGTVEWQAKQKKKLKDSGVIHSSDVAQYARSLLVKMSGDKVSDIKKKGLALNYFTCDIYCLFVDEAQDMNTYFFDLMAKVVPKLEHFYFVGDPFQALWGSDNYREFCKSVEEQIDILTNYNLVTRRLPTCIVQLCNTILPKESAMSSINLESGNVGFLFLSELNDDIRNKLSSSNVFSYIKGKTKIFSTGFKPGLALTDEFKQLLSEKYPSHDESALHRAIVSRINHVGLDNCVNELKITLSESDKQALAKQFNSNAESNIIVEAIQKIKGLEGDTAYFIICNSLLEILLGVKNDYNKETNLLYVALTRAKRRLLLIIDDDDTLRSNFDKRNVNIEVKLRELSVNKAKICDWFN